MALDEPGPVGGRTGRVRAGLVALVRERPLARSVLAWWFVQAYRRPWTPRTARHLADRSTRMFATTRAARRSTVPALVDTFFELVTAWELELFVEAGAKEATAAQRACEIPAVRRTVAFEANPHTYERFAPTLAGTDVEYLQLALDREYGTVDFYVRLSNAGAPIADGQGSLHRKGDHEPGHAVVTVDAVTLDGFLGEVPPGSVGLWVDVEGAVANVFGGAQRTLSCVDVMLVEVEPRPLWSEAQWVADDVVDAAAQAGLVPVARDVQSHGQYNVLFVRRELRRDPATLRALDGWSDWFRSTWRDLERTTPPNR